MGELGTDASKKTLLVYGHLDVQPAAMEDGWNTDPWVLTEKDGKLYGRGSTDDKGPVLGWIHALQCYKQCGIDLPVNFKFCFEGMEESGSEGLDQMLMVSDLAVDINIHLIVFRRGRTPSSCRRWTTAASLITTGWARTSPA